MFFKRGPQNEIDKFKAYQIAESRRIEERAAALNLMSGPANSVADNNHQAQIADAEPVDKVTSTTQEDAISQDSASESVLSANASWEGKLRTQGSIRIGGKLSGSIEAGETVFVAAGAVVRADVSARKVIVGGDLEGHIACHEQLVVEHSGRLGGTVDTATLIVEEGAVVRSQIQMQSEKSNPPDGPGRNRRSKAEADAVARVPQLNSRSRL